MSAEATTFGPFTTPSLRGRSAAQKNGIRYERKVHAELVAEYPEGFVPGQWFRFSDSSGHDRWCQLDGLVRSPEHITLFEVKYTFTSDAWWQLRKLYEPVVRRAFPFFPLRSVIICRNFDPWTKFPEAYTVISTLRDISPSTLCVLPWRL